MSYKRNNTTLKLIRIGEIKRLDKSLEQKENKMKKEIWRDIAGYEGLYQVSNMGRVKSLERIITRKNGKKQTIRERILKPRATPDGYLQLHLNKSGKRKFFFVHRLVCEAFHKNPKNKPCVNHIDENKANNTASNLEWCTYEENNNHGTHNTRVAKALSKSVCQYTVEGEFVKVWQSTREAERQLGIFSASISAAALGKIKTADGYVWKYVDEEK